MKIKTLTAIAAIAITGALAPAAGAAGKADTTVSIKGGPDFFGYVKSSDPANCAEGRTIKLMKILSGSTPKPSVDEYIGSDTASSNGNRYMWSTGNTGAGSGKFYARATGTPECKADNSKVITVS